VSKKTKKQKNNKAKETKRRPLLFYFGRFILKTLVILLFLTYLIFCSTAAWHWSKIKYYQTVPLEHLALAVKQNRDKGDLPVAIGLVKSRWPSQSQEVLDIMIPHAPELDPAFYFEFSRRYSILGNIEEAVFWAMLGRFRMRYDILRCENDETSDLEKTLSDFLIPESVSDYLEDNPDQIKPILQSVLDWDEKNPPQNKPDSFCRERKGFNREASHYPLEKGDWETRYKVLRITTEAFINDESLDYFDIFKKLDEYDKKKPLETENNAEETPEK